MAELPTESSAAEATLDKRRRRKRLIGFFAMVAFVACGFYLFGSKVPQEVAVRFDLPPVVRSPFFAIPRARVSLVTATVTDLDGNWVARIDLPTRHGLEGPRTGWVALNLRRGTYLVHAKVKSFEATEVALEGRLEVDGDEAVIEL